MSLQTVLRSFTISASAAGLSENDYYLRAIAQNDVATLTQIRDEATAQGDTATANILQDNIDAANVGNALGDASGPASSVNNDVVLFNGTTGKLLKDSGYTLNSMFDAYTGHGDVGAPNWPIRYVRVDGSDDPFVDHDTPYGDGTLTHPWASVQYAESQITDADALPGKSYILDIGPGQFAVAGGSFTSASPKKPYIFWRGAGRRSTRIRLQSIGATGGININPSDGVGNYAFTSMVFQNPSTAFTINQPVADGDMTVLFNDVRIAATVTSVRSTGWNASGITITMINSETIGGTDYSSTSLNMYSTQHQSRITADSVGNLTPTPTVLLGDTTFGSTTITVADTSGITPGVSLLITGVGVVTGARVAVTGPTTLEMDIEASSTEVGTTLTITESTTSTISAYFSYFSGITLKQVGIATLNACYNNSSSSTAINLLDAGTRLTAGPESLRSETHITVASGAFLVRSTDAYSLGYTPASPTYWSSPPTEVQGALNNLSGAIYTQVANSRGSPELLDATPAMGVDSVAATQKHYIAGNGAPIVVSANPQIDPGTIDGQVLVLVGRDVTNTVTYADGNGLSLNGSIVLGEDDTITLSWDGTNWVEMSRR